MPSRRRRAAARDDANEEEDVDDDELSVELETKFAATCLFSILRACALLKTRWCITTTTKTTRDDDDDDDDDENDDDESALFFSPLLFFWEVCALRRRTRTRIQRHHRVLLQRTRSITASASAKPPWRMQPAAETRRINAPRSATRTTARARTR